MRTRLKWMAMRWLSSGSIVPTITHPVKRGDTLKLARREWFVVHTPGHTEDHICLHSPELGLFLAGDHVLPTITPHISGISLSNDPLKAFYDSLDLVAAIENVDQALPAHGHPFGDLASRCEAIKRHHDERLDKVRNISTAFGAAATVAGLLAASSSSSAAGVRWPRAKPTHIWSTCGSPATPNARKTSKGTSCI